MKSLLVTGCTGFVGQTLVEALNKTNYRVVSCGRAKVEGVFKHINADFDSLENIELHQYNIDTVIHCAARVHAMGENGNSALERYNTTNTLGTLELARQAEKSGVRRFIFLSSVKVHGEKTELGSPFSRTSPWRPQDHYGKSKCEAEKQLFELASKSTMDVVVLRPTLVYGPGVKGNFEALMNLVSKSVPLPFGSIVDNKRSLVSVCNLVDLIIHCIDNAQASNKAFVVSDGEDVSTSELVEKIANSLGKRALLVPIPTWCYKLAGKFLGRSEAVNRLIGSLHVDVSETQSLLSWEPKQSMDMALKDTAQAFLKKNEMSAEEK